MVEITAHPSTSHLNLAMAGNQWVVFDKFMQAFNEHRAATSHKKIDLSAIGNQPRTFAGLQKRGADYFIELIPPGLERNQIKSGCMLLGNEDSRNFLPTSIQVNFDIFTSTNFNLNPYLHDGTEHKLLIPQRFKKYPLNLWVKTGFFNSTVKPVSYTLYPL